MCSSWSLRSTSTKASPLRALPERLMNIPLRGPETISMSRRGRRPCAWSASSAPRRDAAAVGVGHDDDPAVLARAVDVQVVVLALDQHEGLAPPLVVGRVDEHAVAGARHDLDGEVGGGERAVEDGGARDRAGR